MPVLSIYTNIKYEDKVAEKIISSASRLMANMLEKPEQYVMVILRKDSHMIFAGSQQPLLYAELKSIDLPENKTNEYSARLTEFFEKEMQIPPERVYIEFSNAKAHLWGWNSTTF